MIERGGDAGATREAVGDVGGMLGSGHCDQMCLLCLCQVGGDVQYALSGVAGIEQHSDIAQWMQHGLSPSMPVTRSLPCTDPGAPDAAPL